MIFFMLLGAVGGWCAIGYIVLCAYKALHARRKTRKADLNTFIGANISAVSTQRTRKILRNSTAQLPTETVAEIGTQKPTETVAEIGTQTATQPLQTIAETVAKPTTKPCTNTSAKAEVSA